MRTLSLNVQGAAVEDAVLAIVWRLGDVRRQLIGDDDIGELLVCHVRSSIFPDHIEHPLQLAAQINPALLDLVKIELFTDYITRLLDDKSFNKYGRHMHVYGESHRKRVYEEFDITTSLEEYKSLRSKAIEVDKGSLGLENKIRSMIDRSVGNRLGGIYALSALNTAQIEDMRRDIKDIKAMVGGDPEPKSPLLAVRRWLRWNPNPDIS